MKKKIRSRKHFYRMFCFLSLCFLFIPISAYAASLSLNDTHAKPDDSVSIDILYSTDSDSVSAMNFDVHYDDTRLILSDITIETAGVVAGKILDKNSLSGGVERVIIYGLNSNAIGDGIIATVSFTVRQDALEGDASISFANMAGASGSAQSVGISGTGCVITVDVAEPMVTITSPADGDSLGTDTVTVDGTVDDLTITEVDVNGQIVAVSNGSFTVDITLTEGDNTIVVTATDAVGNDGIASITIRYLNGDVNEDGIIDNVDITVVRDQILGILAVTIPGDVNSDGNVNVIDLQRVVNKLN